MKTTTTLALCAASLLLPSRAWADQCCTFNSVSCELRDHEDARCSTGTRSVVRLNDVWGCPQANQIVINGDPVIFAISLAIATENARVYCEDQSADSCPDNFGGMCGDTDDDGLWDIWERLGIDGDGDGVPETLLPGADVRRKDLFLEIDCLKSDGNGDGDYSDATDHSHCPKPGHSAAHRRGHSVWSGDHH